MLSMDLIEAIIRCVLGKLHSTRVAGGVAFSGAAAVYARCLDWPKSAIGPWKSHSAPELSLHQRYPFELH